MELFYIQLKQNGKWCNVGNSCESERDAEQALRKILNTYNDELCKSGGVFQYRIIQLRNISVDHEFVVVRSARTHGLYGYKIIDGDAWEKQLSVGLHENVIE